MCQKSSLFVKASSEGSSHGCFKINCGDFEEAKKRIHEAFNYSPYVLVEPALKMREIEVAIWDLDGEVSVSFPGEIITEGKFYDFESKYSSTSSASPTSHAQNLNDSLATEIQLTALKAWRLFKLKDLARIDFFLTEEGEVFLNEINTMPGMTQVSLFPQMMKESGINFSDYLKRKVFSNRSII